MRRSVARAQVAAVRPRFAKGYNAIEIVSPMASKCRVCKLTIDAGDPRLFRPWGIEAAHLICGWLRADETDPHRCEGANAPNAWEWACTTCGRDVVRPHVTEDRRCTACQAAAARAALAKMHAAAHGAICQDRGDGTCDACGIALVRCLECGGRGYHLAGCAEIDREC